MATTFATNHIRQIGVGLAKEVRYFRSKNKSHREKLQQHVEMLMFFLAGSALGTVSCNLFAGKAIWGTLIPLGVVFCALLHADLVTEKNMKQKKPAGH